LKLPRDLSGSDLVKLLGRYGYESTRQAGSHIRLESKIRGTQHHVTVPAHKNITIGTLAAILTDVAQYLQMSRSQLERQLFGS